MVKLTYEALRIYLREAQVRKIKKLAKESGMTVSDYCRRVFDIFFKHEVKMESDPWVGGRKS